MRVLIGFSRSNTLFGKIIRKVTGSHWNHAFILYESKLWGGWWGVQIDEKGVNKIPVQRLYPEYDEYELWEPKQYVDLSVGLRANREYIGARYDWLGILGYLCKWIVWHVSGRRVLNPIQDGAKMFCSEFCASVLQQSGAIAPLHRFMKPASTSPGLLRNVVAGSGIFNKLGVDICDL